MAKKLSNVSEKIIKDIVSTESLYIIKINNLNEISNLTG